MALSETRAALDEAAARLAGAQRLLIGTAAGMSAESGIPTYRRPGETSWRNLNPDANSKGAREADVQLSLGAREGLLELAERVL